MTRIEKYYAGQLKWDDLSDSERDFILAEETGNDSGTDEEDEFDDDVYDQYEPDDFEDDGYSSSQRMWADRSDYANEQLQAGRIDPEQAAEIRAGA